MNQICMPVMTGIPPRCAVKDGFYGDRYSDPVWLSSGYAAQWDFQNSGWVLKGLHSGPSPADYDELPKGGRALKIQWLPLPPAKHSQMSFPAAAVLAGATMEAVADKVLARWLDRPAICNPTKVMAQYIQESMDPSSPGVAELARIHVAARKKDKKP